MKLLHEIIDINFDTESAYRTLSVTFDLPNLVKNLLKTFAYSGLTLKSLDTNLTDFAKNPDNQKALIDSYAQFIQGLCLSDSLDLEYPETANILKTADAYAKSPAMQSTVDNLSDTLGLGQPGKADVLKTAAESVTMQSLVENAFNLAFSMFDVKDLIWINKPVLGAYYEFAKYLYTESGQIQTQSEVKNPPTIKSLYEAMYASPEFETIPVNSAAYIDLAFMAYACEHFNAFLGVAYIPADYLNENKQDLNFGDIWGLRVIPLFAYPALNTNITLYYDQKTYEFTAVKPVHGDFSTFTNIKAFNPDAKPIESCSFTVGTGTEVGYIRGTYKDADGNTIPIATFNGNSMNMEAGFNIPIILKNEAVQAMTFEDGYYRVMNTNNAYWHLADNTYLSAYYASSVKISQMGLSSDTMKSLINSGVLELEGYQIIAGDENPIQDLQPNEDYENAYTTGDGIQITTPENNSSVSIPLMGDLDYEKILSGEKTIFEVLKENGLYVTSATDPNQTISGSENIVDKPLQEHKDTTNPLIYTSIPSSLFDVYILNSFNMSALGSQLFDPDVNAALRRVFDDPGQAIISLGFIPFSFNNLQVGEVRIGNYPTGINAYKAGAQYMELDYGAYRFEKLDYLSIEPYAEYEIFIPYAGKFPILSSLFSGKTVRLRCIVDIITGDMITSMYVSENSFSESAYYARNIQDMPVATFAGNCLRRIPISTASGIGYLNAAAKIGYGAAVIASAVTREAVGSSLASMAGQFMPATIAPSIKTVGEMTGNNGYMGIIKPYIIGRRRGVPGHVNGNQIKSYSNIGHEVPLGCCHGYTEMVNLQTQFTGVETFPSTPVPTSSEITEINEALTNGVILP